jgi:Holliday junction resolvase RusA-like endonuclease
MGDINLPDSYLSVFHISMPQSWSAKKRDLMRGKPHQQKPDDDNLSKALKDALMKSDQVVYCGAPLKLWADNGKVEIYELTVTYELY